MYIAKTLTSSTGILHAVNQGLYSNKSMAERPTLIELNIVILFIVLSTYAFMLFYLYKCFALFRGELR